MSLASFCSMHRAFCKCLLLLFFILAKDSVSAASEDDVTLQRGSVKLGSRLSPTQNKYWVSENGTFALGFFTEQQSGMYAVGIWYHSLPRQAQVVVWTAGQDVTVTSSSLLELSPDGNLVLFDEGIPAWASNTSCNGIVSACLLENGNFVLKDGRQRAVWDSFSAPSNTLLPGQSLVRDQLLRASARNSIASYYSLSMSCINETCNLFLSWGDDVSYWAASVSEPGFAQRLVFGDLGNVALEDGQGRSLWCKYSNDYNDPNVAFRHLRLDVDGNLRMYSWSEGSQTWRVGWQAVENQCDVFGTCGVYGLCTFNTTGPICQCPFQRGPSSSSSATSKALDSGSRSPCSMDMKLGHCSGANTMLKLQHTLLYGIYPPQDVYNYSSEKDCKNNCLRDEYCVAATALNDGSGICRIKRSTFISGFSYASTPASSFLKICLAPEAVSKQIPGVASSAPDFGSLNSNPFLASSSSLRLENFREFCNLLKAGLPIVIFFVAIELWVGFILFRRSRLRKTISVLNNYLVDSHSESPLRITYSEVLHLTGNFCNRLGPSVFLGSLPNQRLIVVKKLDIEMTEKEFSKALRVLGSTRHRNLVLLRGFCFDIEHTLLLYEFVPNGSLYQWLFGSSHQGEELHWERRFAVASGVARAIAYLHFECHECIAHSNLKLENVMLDENFSPKVADYGVGRLLRSPSHQCPSTSETDAEKDVYNFGVLLLQMITGKRYHPTASDNSWTCKWALNEFQSGNLQNLTDSRMAGNVNWGQAERVLRIAFWCIHEQAFSRPSMREVVKVLEGTLPVERPPVKAVQIDQESQARRSCEIRRELQTL